MSSNDDSRRKEICIIEQKMMKIFSILSVLHDKLSIILDIFFIMNIFLFKRERKRKTGNSL
jgi:hypothetical protein